MQTRYYDPETCRFISQDSIDYADPETINGLNLYAYCGNNPVMRADYAGTSWNSFWSAVGRFLGGLALFAVGAAIALSTIIPAIISPLATGICEFGITAGSYGAALVGSVFNSAIYADMERIGWNVFNSNANLVCDSSIMSFYKGVPVLRYGDYHKGDRSGTFGIIFLARNEMAKTVKHEFGHIPQLMLLGIFNYFTCIGIPSYKYWHKKNSWEYYQAPWDAGADYFGGVSRNYSNIYYKRALEYMAYSFILGPTMHAFYKRF